MKLHSKDTNGRAGTRRSFLRTIGWLAGAGVVPGRKLTRLAQLVDPQRRSDEEICQRKFEIAVRESLASRPMGEVMVAIGTSFLGTPYEAHTLEAEGPEHLVINLRALDCVTFVENTLAISRCVKLGTQSFDDYRKQLELIRYRGGRIEGYESRLHYFSDWIYDNAAKGIVRDVTRELGGSTYNKKISFMTDHPESYKQLSDRRALEIVARWEAELNQRNMFYIPKESLDKAQKGIQAGDIIGITTSIEGLDISHTGMAVVSNGVVKYLHAPLSSGVVQISENSIVDYLMSHKKQTGIMVARALEV
jgi:hypothetical protein